MSKNVTDIYSVQHDYKYGGSEEKRAKQMLATKCRISLFPFCTGKEKGQCVCERGREGREGGESLLTKASINIAMVSWAPKDAHSKTLPVSILAWCESGSHYGILPCQGCHSVVNAPCGEEPQCLADGLRVLCQLFCHELEEIKSIHRILRQGTLEHSVMAHTTYKYQWAFLGGKELYTYALTAQS